MKLTTAKGKIKGFVATVLAISIFAGFFAAVNNRVLAASMEEEVSIPTAYQEEYQLKEVSSDYVKANYTVIEDETSPATSEYALSAGEAAELGAQYLWDAFGVDLEGEIIYILYGIASDGAIPHWYGRVYDSEEEIGIPPYYSFSIEAITGVRYSVTYWPKATGDFIGYNSEEADNYYQDNCDEFLEAAKTIAALQLSAEPVSAEYCNTAPFYIENEPNVLLCVCYYLIIMVTDSNGNQVGISLDASDMSLISIIGGYEGIDYVHYSVADYRID